MGCQCVQQRLSAAALDEDALEGLGCECNAAEGGAEGRGNVLAGVVGAEEDGEGADGLGGSDVGEGLGALGEGMEEGYAAAAEGGVVGMLLEDGEN